MRSDKSARNHRAGLCLAATLHWLTSGFSNTSSRTDPHRFKASSHNPGQQKLTLLGASTNVDKRRRQYVLT